MKIKKIKNIILTFVICLFGAFAFNDLKVNATDFENTGILYNEGQTLRNKVVVDPNGNVTNSQDQNYNYLIFNYYDGDYMFTIVDNNRNYLMTFRECNAQPSPDLNSLYTFTCQNAYTIFNNSSVPSVAQTSSTKVFQIVRSLSSNSYSVRVQFNSGSSYVYRYFDIYDSYELGFESGLIEGQHRGYDRGYDDGYFDGVGNRNTLVGMVGAIFTGPITMLTSIFNFEILGINFVEMLLGLTTLLVVIWLIKKFI